MPGVAGHEIIRFGGFGAFEKAVVGFVGGDGERLGRRHEVGNLADGGKHLVYLPRL